MKNVPTRILLKFQKSKFFKATQHLIGKIVIEKVDMRTANEIFYRVVRLLQIKRAMTPRKKSYSA